jgi:hypothetical protein
MPRSKKRKEKKKHHPRNELVKKTLSSGKLHNQTTDSKISKNQSPGTFLNHFLNHFTNLLSASFSQSAATAPDAD